ncbi:hypothetical protein [Streptosporangium roseum]|uniref:hypothetical protein n=1 Tax=Streptosporangium roseum TaxID=2001 RepID=UPI0002EF203A|nr:hypothetical protein [Streptosporangium roseum]
MTSHPLVLGRHAEVRAALADPAPTVVAAPRPPFAPTVARLRGAARPGPTGTTAEVTVVLDLAAANRDPLVFDAPDRFRPGPAQGHPTFGAGPRPCPGREVAPARAAGVVGAVRR